MQKLTLIGLVILGLLVGCDKVHQANAKIATMTNNAVTQYCATPREARQALHLAVKKAIAPNEITISCAEDVKPY